MSDFAPATRRQRCTVTARGAGAGASPRNTGTNCSIPAIVNSVVLISSGISEAEGRCACPLRTKKSTNAWRSSWDVMADPCGSPRPPPRPTAQAPRLRRAQHPRAVRGRFGEVSDSTDRKMGPVSAAPPAERKSASSWWYLVAVLIYAPTILFAYVVLALAWLWAIAGVTALSALTQRVDWHGWFWLPLFTGAILFGPRKALFAGIFIAVTDLELAGTWFGAWTWLPNTPWAHVTSGNPPSAIAGGYAVIDGSVLLIVALLAELARRRARVTSLAESSSASRAPSAGGARRASATR